MTPTTLPLALAQALAADPSRPLLTWIAAGGERTELSVRTFENNVAKAANLLQDDVAVDDASRVALHLPAHWQTAVWLGACAAVGCAAWLDADDSDPSVALAVVGPAAVATGAPETLATALHPLGMPFREPLPAGVLDAAVEVRAHGDRFVAYAPPTSSTPWLMSGSVPGSGAGLTQGDALEAAQEMSTRIGSTAGARVLVRVGGDPVDVRAALALVALPLLVDGSVVLLADLDADVAAVVAGERCDAVLDLVPG